MFYCYAPLLPPSSNGIKVLYLLAQQLSQGGVETKVLCYERGTLSEIPKEFRDRTVFLNQSRTKIHRHDIVLYPETESDNPIEATQIVRFFGNRPYYLTGKGIKYTDSDYLTAHSRAVDLMLPQLFLMDDETSLMHRLRRIRKGNDLSIYYGKVNKDTIIRKTQLLQALLPEFDRVHVLTRGFPERRIELLTLLAKSELLISFDPLSNTCYEATLLNTPVILMDDEFGISNGEFNIPLWGISSSISDLEKIHEEVRYSFATYQEHLNSQTEMVRRWSDAVHAHFHSIYFEHDTAYLRRNASLLERQKQIDKIRFSYYKSGKVLRNITHPIDLPMKVLRTLRRQDYVLAKQSGRLKRLLKAFLKKCGLFKLAYAIWQTFELKKKMPTSLPKS